MKLSVAQKEEIKTKLDAGTPVAALASEYGVTAVTIYTIKKASHREPTTLSLLEKEIAAAEQEITALEKARERIALLRDGIVVRRAALESLKKLEGLK